MLGSDTVVMNLVAVGAAFAYLWLTRSAKKTTRKENTPSTPSPGD